MHGVRIVLPAKVTEPITTSMAKRMNIILEDETELTIKRSAKPGERSRFIDRAVQYYAATHSPAALRARLKHAALRDRDLGEEIARDWRAVDREAWQSLSRGERKTKRSTRGAEKSTS
jgi:CopG family transcriptional regulator/antitoxin EndoAI